jgi:hypothetical protein
MAGLREKEQREEEGVALSTTSTGGVALLLMAGLGDYYSRNHIRSYQPNLTESIWK